MKITNNLSRLLDILFPRECVLCNRVIYQNEPWPVCRDCVKKLPLIEGRICTFCGRALLSEQETCLTCRGREFPYKKAMALMNYSNLGRKLMRSWKFARRHSIAALYAGLLYKTITEFFPDSAIVPVPPRPGKMRKELYDNIALLSRILKKKYGMEKLDLLGRRGKKQQKSLNRDARAGNAQRSYFLKTRKIDVNKKLLILDDVITTGATASACAKLLIDAGCVEVNVLAITAD